MKQYLNESRRYSQQRKILAIVCAVIFAVSVLWVVKEACAEYVDQLIYAAIIGAWASFMVGLIAFFNWLRTWQSCNMAEDMIKKETGMSFPTVGRLVLGEYVAYHTELKNFIVYGNVKWIKPQAGVIYFLGRSAKYNRKMDMCGILGVKTRYLHDDEFYALGRAILQKYPDVIVGSEQENQKEYKAYLKETKKQLGKVG